MHRRLPTAITFRRAAGAAVTLAVAVAATFPAMSRAASASWTGAAGDGLWATPGNWDTNSPPGVTDGTYVSPDVATFAGTPASVAVTVDPNRNVAGLTFTNAAYDGDNAALVPYTIGLATGSNALYFSNGGVTQTTGTVTYVQNSATATTVSESVNAPIYLAGPTYTFLANAPSGAATVGLVFRGNIAPLGPSPTTLTLDGTNIGVSSNTGASQILGNLSDGPGSATLGLVKNGAGYWEIRGANTYSGDTVVNGGLLRFVDNSTDESASPNTHIIINNGGRVRASGNTVNGATVVPILPSVEVRTGGKVETSNSTTPLNLRSNAGPALYFNFSSGAAGTSSYYTSGAPVNFLGTTPSEGGVKLSATASQAAVNFGGTGTVVDLGSVLRPFDIGLTGKTDSSTGNPVDYDLRIRGPLSGTGGILKLGPGALRLDNATQSWSGPLDIRQGSVSVNSAVSLTPNVSLSVSGGGDFHTYGTQSHTFSTVTVSGGTLSASSNASTLHATSFTFNPAATETATADTVLADNASPATVTKNGAGTATLTGVNTYTGVTTVNAGTLVLKGSGARDNVLNNAGAVVSTGATLSFDYDGANGGGTVQGQIVGLLRSGAASNFSSGPIRSAIPSSTRAFGWVDDGNAVKVTGTYYGDLNLDGKVNGDDYALLDRGNANHLAGWTNGDLNYDGTIDQNDYLLIDTTYATSGIPHEALATLLSDRLSEFGPDYVAALTAAVPEPASLAACGLALLPLARRRRR